MTTENPSAATLDVLAVLDRKIGETEGRATFYNALSDFKQQQAEETALTEMRNIRTAVASLLSRNAELEAERDALRAQHEWNKACAYQVDSLLEMAGYTPESSARNTISMMNFDALARTPAHPQQETGHENDPSS
jgi:hypothetical protein